MKNKKPSPKEISLPKEIPLKAKEGPLDGGALVPGIQPISLIPDSPIPEPQKGAPVPGIQPISPKPDSPAPEPQNTPSEPPSEPPPSTEPSDE